MAMVPTNDRRVKALRKKNGTLHRLLNQFKDGFGYKLEPSILLVNEKAPEATAGSAAVLAFRDIIGFCGSLPSQARIAMDKTAGAAVMQEAFAFFPWAYPTEKDHPDALHRISQLHVVPDFHCRSTPGPFPVDFDYQQDLDAPLLAVLGHRWREHYETRSGDVINEALFRALNLASEAALITTLPYIDISRIGKIATLWCGAFEMLIPVSDKGSDDTSASVIEMLDSISWVLPESSQVVSEGRTAAAHLYDRLAQCRIDYKMCRPVDTAVFPGSKRSTLEFVSPLFRLALTAYLGMQPPKEAQGVPADETFARSLTGRIAYAEAQQACENAILQPWL